MARCTETPSNIYISVKITFLRFGWIYRLRQDTQQRVNAVEDEFQAKLEGVDERPSSRHLGR